MEIRDEVNEKLKSLHGIRFTKDQVDWFVEAVLAFMSETGSDQTQTIILGLKLLTKKE